MDNQIEHLCGLLKWRMDLVDVEPQRSLELAVGELHQKIFTNYKRWVSHVNVQQYVIEECEEEPGSFSMGIGRGARMVPLSALNGNAWDFIGMWGFESGAEERAWVCNAQLHQLMLWYLIWGEAANLRHMPELLCFITYCASNALTLSSKSPWEVRSFAV